MMLLRMVAWVMIQPSSQREIERQTDKGTDRQRQRQTHRHIDRHIDTQGQRHRESFTFNFQTPTTPFKLKFRLLTGCKAALRMRTERL